MQKLKEKLKLILGGAIIGILCFIPHNVYAEKSTSDAELLKINDLYQTASCMTLKELERCLNCELQALEVIKECLSFSDEVGDRLSLIELKYKANLLNLGKFIIQYRQNSHLTILLYTNLLYYVRPEFLESDCPLNKYMYFIEKISFTKNALQSNIILLEEITRNFLTTANFLLELKPQIDSSRFKYSNIQLNVGFYNVTKMRNQCFNNYIYNVHGEVSDILKLCKGYKKLLSCFDSSEEGF